MAVKKKKKNCERTYWQYEKGKKKTPKHSDAGREGWKPEIMCVVEFETSRNRKVPELRQWIKFNYRNPPMKMDNLERRLVFCIQMFDSKGLQLEGQGDLYTYKHTLSPHTHFSAPAGFSIMSDEVFTPLTWVNKFVFIFKHTLNASPMWFSTSNEAINFQKAIHMPRKSMLIVGLAQPRSCT